MKKKKLQEGWTLGMRSSGLIEHICPHGVGHPDVKSAEQVAKRYGDSVDVWMSHGCDGCCNLTNKKRATH